MSERVLRALLVAAALFQLVVGLWQLLGTESFGDAVAPFNGFNEHDLRDFATFYLALGLALLVAVRWREWRFPVLCVAGLQYALHTVNHAIDVGNSDRGWVGPVDLAAVAAGTLVFAWLAWETTRVAASSVPDGDLERGEG